DQARTPVRRPRRSGADAAAERQRGGQPDPQDLEPTELVAVAMGQIQGQGRAQLRPELRGRARRRGDATARAGGDLRSRSPRLDPRFSGRALHQLRRLGRELQCGGRALRRPAGDRLMEDRPLPRAVRRRNHRGSCDLMRILIATDAWFPQVNGVVQTLVSVGQALEKLGVEVSFLTPEGIPSIPLPTYPDIRLALPSSRAIARRIDEFRPDVVHIATEGPIGHLVRRHCLKRRRWSWLRWFHNAGRVTMASTNSRTNELMAR